MVKKPNMSRSEIGRVTPWDGKMSGREINLSSLDGDTYNDELQWDDES